MHSRMLTRAAGSGATPWKWGLASALCQKSAFAITQQTEGEAFHARANTQLENGKGNSDVQVNQKAKNFKFETPYGDNIVFAANTEHTGNKCGEKSFDRWGNEWRMEDKERCLKRNAKFEHEVKSENGFKSVRTTMTHSFTAGGEVEAGAWNELDEKTKNLRDLHRGFYSSVSDKSDFEANVDWASFNPLENEAAKAAGVPIKGSAHNEGPRALGTPATETSGAPATGTSGTPAGETSGNPTTETSDPSVNDWASRQNWPQMPRFPIRFPRIQFPRISFDPWDPFEDFFEPQEQRNAPTAPADQADRSTATADLTPTNN